MPYKRWYLSPPPKNLGVISIYRHRDSMCRYRSRSEQRFTARDNTPHKIFLHRSSQPQSKLCIGRYVMFLSSSCVLRKNNNILIKKLSESFGFFRIFLLFYCYLFLFLSLTFYWSEKTHSSFAQLRKWNLTSKLPHQHSNTKLTCPCKTKTRAWILSTVAKLWWKL